MEMKEEDQHRDGPIRGGLTCAPSLGGFWGGPVNSATPSVRERKDSHSSCSHGHVGTLQDPWDPCHVLHNPGAACPTVAGHPDPPQPCHLPTGSDPLGPPRPGQAKLLPTIWDFFHGGSQSWAGYGPEAPRGSAQGSPLAAPKRVLPGGGHGQPHTPWSCGHSL